MARPSYEIVDVTDKNIDDVGLFCQKSRPKETGYRAKVSWFKEQFRKGLRTKLVGFQNDKGRFVFVGFVEYGPGENTWRGVEAKNWLVVQCLWVIGKHKGQGLGTELLGECIKEAREDEMNGVAAIASGAHWLTNSKLYVKNGFEEVDEMPPFKLYAKRMRNDAESPKFRPISQQRLSSFGRGLIVMESHQCPYTPRTVESIRRMAERAGIPLQIVHNASCVEARKNTIHPYGTFCVVLDGRPISYYPGDTTQVRQALRERLPD